MDYQDLQSEGTEMMQPEPNLPAGYRPADPETTRKPPPNHMAAASMVLGIIALVTFCCYYTVLPLGGLSILFALLSRPDGKFTAQAKAGIIMASIAMVLTALFWLILVVWLSAYMGEPAVQNMPMIPPVQNMPTVPPIPDNVLTAFGLFPTGGVR